MLPIQPQPKPDLERLTLILHTRFVHELLHPICSDQVYTPMHFTHTLAHTSVLCKCKITGFTWEGSQYLWMFGLVRCRCSLQKRCWHLLLTCICFKKRILIPFCYYFLKVMLISLSILMECLNTLERSRWWMLLSLVILHQPNK